MENNNTLIVRMNPAFKRFDCPSLNSSCVPEPVALQAMKNLVIELERKYKSFIFAHIPLKKIHFLTIASIMLIYAGLFLSIWVSIFFIFLLIFSVVILLAIMLLTIFLIPNRIRSYERTVQTIVTLHNDRALLQVGIRSSFTFRIISYQICFTVMFTLPSGTINPNPNLLLPNNPSPIPLQFNIPIEAVQIEDDHFFEPANEDNRLDIFIEGPNEKPQHLRSSNVYRVINDSGDFMGFINKDDFARQKEELVSDEIVQEIGPKPQKNISSVGKPDQSPSSSAFLLNTSEEPRNMVFPLENMDVNPEVMAQTIKPEEEAQRTSNPANERGYKDENGEMLGRNRENEEGNSQGERKACDENMENHKEEAEIELEIREIQVSLQRNEEEKTDELPTENRKVIAEESEKDQKVQIETKNSQVFRRRRSQTNKMEKDAELGTFQRENQIEIVQSLRKPSRNIIAPEKSGDNLEVSNDASNMSIDFGIEAG